MSKTLANILLLNGPNLNLLGEREPEVYGNETLQNIESRVMQLARESGHDLSAFQSNSESELVERIHAASKESAHYAICNFGAFTHTSIAIRDALLGTKIPFIEVHISNVYARESFRHSSYFNDIATGSIVGLGSYGYDLALKFIDKELNQEN